MLYEHAIAPEVFGRADDGLAANDAARYEHTLHSPLTELLRGLIKEGGTRSGSRQGRTLPAYRK